MSDVLDDGTVADVTCPTLTVQPGGSVVCMYTASPVDDSATLNTATVSMTGTGTQTATAPVSFTAVRNGDEDVTLADTRLEYSESISDTTPVDQAEEFFCSANEADYTNGSYSYTEKNTATLTGENTDRDQGRHRHRHLHPGQVGRDEDR